VPELNSSVASQTPNTSADSSIAIVIEVLGTETYLPGSVGAMISSAAPTISVTAASAAPVQRGIGR
jgi:hypothetical protein